MYSSAESREGRSVVTVQAPAFQRGWGGEHCGVPTRRASLVDITVDDITVGNSVAL